MDGIIYDTLIAQSRKIKPPPAERERPVVVVAMDEASLIAPELLSFPRVYFTPVWAQLLDGIYTAGAKASGFDIIFAWSASQLYPGLENPFLRTLARYKDRTSIGRTATFPPVKSFYFAAGANDLSVPFLEIEPDSDGILRRVPLTTYVNEQGEKPTLVGALVQRLGIKDAPDVTLIAPKEPAELQIPTYSMIDVKRCIELDPAAVKSAFDGKVVLFGTTIADEDRKYASDRFMTKLQATAKPVDPGNENECNLVPLARSQIASTSIPGVHVHAMALEQIINREHILITSLTMILIIGGGLALLISGVGVSLSFSRALSVTGITLVGLYAVASILIINGVYLRLSLLLISVVMALFIAYAARYVFEERKRIRIQAAFGTYLAPSIVQSLSENSKNLKMGGENRELTIFFADLSGFTTLSTKVDAETLTTTVNRYLTQLVNAVEATGGYIDKFIGDAVMAYWGAPTNDPNHAVHAVTAAIDAYQRVVTQKAIDDEAGIPSFKVKIGLNTGIAIVGNVGTEGRRNYTAIGEAVNVAARLESVPTDYNCQIVIGPDTAAQIYQTYLVHELDAIQVKGRAKPVPVFRPICLQAEAQHTDREFISGYAEALKLYRGQKFKEAVEKFTYLVAEFPEHLTGPAAAMILRAQGYIDHPPPADWDGVWVKPTK